MTTFPEDDNAPPNLPSPVPPAFEDMSKSVPVPLEPEDLTKYALTNDFHERVAKKVLTCIPIGKPPRHTFVRTHPDPEFWKAFGTIEIKETGKTYVVAPPLAAALRDEGESAFSQANLVLAIDRRGNLFLWKLKVSDRDNDWNSSARRAAEIARDKWVRVQSNMAAGCYDTLVAATQEPQPVWPTESYKQILGVAFKDLLISHATHPVLQELRGI